MKLETFIIAIFAWVVSCGAVPNKSSKCLAVSSTATTSKSKKIPTTKPTPTFKTYASTKAITRPSTTSKVNIFPPIDYITNGLYYHNKHRLNHSAPILTWNATQAKYAAQIAASCVFKHNMGIDGGGYGQNLAAYGTSGDMASIDPASMLARAISDQWYYGEVNLFLPSYYGQPNAGKLPDFKSWGHFSQVIWKGTSSVGCASQLCPAGTIFAPISSWYTVCNYLSPGNVEGAFHLNVLPSIGLPAISSI